MRRDEPSAALDASQAAVAASGIKGMMPFGQPVARPFLEYVISALADAGITNVVLVIGPSHDLMRRHFTMGVSTSRVQVRFVVQPEPLGTANAVAIAADSVGSEPFLVLNSDNYYPVEAFRLLVEYGDAATVAFDRAALIRLGNIPAERVQAFAALDVDADGTLRGVVEKPAGEWAADDPRFRWVGMNLWCITPALADACRRVPRSARGEFELPEAVALAIAEGVRVQAMPFESGVLDLSHRSDVNAVQQALADITLRL